VQDVVAAGVGNVVRSSALFTIILRRVSRHLLQKKPMILSVVKKRKGSIKKNIVQVVIIVTVIQDGNQ